MSKDHMFHFVSVIVPCYNEEKFIGPCLDSIIANGYPPDQMEVMVIDGISQDGTREIVADYVKGYPFIRLVDNPKRILASAWNLGIRNSRGDVIMALNAHGSYRPGYIASCVKHLDAYDADYAGGIIITRPRNHALMDEAVATVLSHPFGVGNSYFRIGLEKADWADTAAFGGYRRGLFEKTGLFNEDLARSQDMEFHLRLKKMGGKILLVPDMVCDYYIRSSLKEFCRDYFVNGYWVIYPLKFTRVAVSWRHLVPLAFVISLLGSAALYPFHALFGGLFLSILGLYLAVNLYFSAGIAWAKKDLRYLLVTPVLFTILHVGYGIGSLLAGLKVLGSKLLGKKTDAAAHAH